MKAIVFVSFLCCISCTPKANIKITNSNEAFLSIDMASSKATKKLLKSLANFSSDSVFSDREEDISNIKTEDGIEIIKLKKTSSLDFTATLKFSNSSKLLSSMFSFNKNKLNILLNRNIINSFFSNMLEEDAEYLDLLMAPSLQNIDMKDEEYINLIASAYGNTVANELKNSNLILSI
ncbi:MAG: hypothetical protein ACTTKH_06265, partial [Treponema sp.]